jgi:radical SAM protein with 4Fe4S-binding SPASM domain
MIDEVLCTAPLNAILIDTNKGIRPCCYYEGDFLGNIKNQTISEILSNDKWKKLKKQMYDKEWPTECLGCKRIEDASGHSLRVAYVGGGGIDVTGWKEEKLTYLEFNGSNICNLACLHCHGGFSSLPHSQPEATT